ncbi:uncharacterized protein LOC135199234 [Macrobrachium nipponense]|uniref:uncharacterized protein LOC135199234 n=1 Tax=Macrobrachium nipponense TaxID=159736 RepID=UPI0030C8AC56
MFIFRENSDVKTAKGNPSMDDLRPYLPSEWSNEERIRTLMGPMPTAQDEVARTARLTFWTAAIHHWCYVTKKLTFTFQESLSAFRRGTQQPLCLSDVLLHMNRLGEVVPLDELPLGEQGEESWLAGEEEYSYQLHHDLHGIKVKQALGANNINSKVFVDTKLLQQSRRLCWSADNLHLVVEALVHNGRAATTVHKDMTYVKLAVFNNQMVPVTDHQIRLSSLLLLIQNSITAENELHVAQKGVATIFPN